MHLNFIPEVGLISISRDLLAMIADELRAGAVTEEPDKKTRSMMMLLSEVPIVSVTRNTSHNLFYLSDPGEIPAELSTLTGLRQLDLKNNQLSGECLYVRCKIHHGTACSKVCNIVSIEAHSSLCYRHVSVQ